MWSSGRVRSYSSRVLEHEPTQSVPEENDDEEINQIDEAEEILLYY